MDQRGGHMKKTRKNVEKKEYEEKEKKMRKKKKSITRDGKEE